MTEYNTERLKFNIVRKHVFAAEQVSSVRTGLKASPEVPLIHFC